MINVYALKVRSLSVDYMSISWKIQETFDDVLDYTFQVQRSEAVGGPWENLSVPFTDKFLFFDRLTRPFHLARTLHYRIVTTNIQTNESVISTPANLQADPDLNALEMRRQMGLLMREFAGRRCWLLPIRTFGSRCSCWNKTLQKRTRSGCGQCYDTGFFRGYHTPIEIWAQVEPGQNLAEQVTNVGLLQQQNTIARTVDAWDIKPRDILIEAENKRWRVAQINQTELGRAPVQIIMQLHQIPTSDIEYNYELKLEEALESLWFSPARNFTNPQNFQAFEDEEIPRIFNLYPTTYTDPNK